jgi:hypothetical protein
VASLPGVAPHLRRYRNTSEVRYLGYDLRRGLGADVKEIQRYLDDGERQPGGGGGGADSGGWGVRV